MQIIFNLLERCVEHLNGGIVLRSSDFIIAFKLLLLVVLSSGFAWRTHCCVLFIALPYFALICSAPALLCFSASPALCTQLILFVCYMYKSFVCEKPDTVHMENLNEIYHLPFYISGSIYSCALGFWCAFRFVFMAKQTAASPTDYPNMKHQ